MNVHLTPELEQLVHSKVESGRYNSASEVVRDALRLMEQRTSFAPFSCSNSAAESTKAFRGSTVEKVLTANSSCSA
jgi:hypothetical protein